MKKYKSPKFNANTSKEERTKLVTALRAVAGVEGVTLHPATSEFEVNTRDKQEPQREAIAAAASKAGFPLTAS